MVEDADFNGAILNTDDVYHWIPQAGLPGYKGADYNLNGVIQNTGPLFHMDT